MVDFVTSAAQSLGEALSGLFWPALFFLCLGFIIKRGALFADIWRAAAETNLNLKIMVFNVLFVLPIIGIMYQFVFELVSSYNLVLIDPEYWASLPTLLVIVVTVFLGDFVGYWRHRLEHSKLLWPSHAVHHSDTEMTWLTLERFHPINRLSTSVVDYSVLLVLGVPPFALIANALVRHYYGFLIHADLPWTYGKLSYVFVSPAMHRWHHAADSRFFYTNYATVFSVFDRMFGTYRVPGPCTSPLGVTDDMESSLVGQMTYALSPRAYRRLFGSLFSARKPHANTADTPSAN